MALPQGLLIQGGVAAWEPASPSKDPGGGQGGEQLRAQPLASVSDREQRVQTQRLGGRGGVSHQDRGCFQARLLLLLRTFTQTEAPQGTASNSQCRLFYSKAPSLTTESLMLPRDQTPPVHRFS